MTQLVDITLHLPPSPILTGRTEPVVEAWLDDVKASYGREGLSEVQFWMNQFFQNPTPFYETQVVEQNIGRDRVIHDRGIIYGPWLAGEGSRNHTTPFKGYSHWRRTLQFLEDHEGPAIIARKLPDLLRRLRGGI